MSSFGQCFDKSAIFHGFDGMKRAVGLTVSHVSAKSNDFNSVFFDLKIICICLSNAAQGCLGGGWFRGEGGCPLLVLKNTLREGPTIQVVVNVQCYLT